MSSIRIISIQAKDLYNSRYLEGGYSPRTVDGDINKRLFLAALDESLDLMKLRELYSKVYRKNTFSFTDKNKEYTTRVICVKFRLSQRLYNKSGDIYIRDGYRLRDVYREMSDGFVIRNDCLIAVRIGAPCETENAVKLAPYFGIENGRIVQTAEPPVIMSGAQLRDELYENGFICGNIRYIRWKRSSGSSRVGKCLFIDEKLYPRMHKWECMGIAPKAGQEIDLAAFEAYTALTSSSIIDTLTLDPEEFLIINDRISSFSDNAAGVTAENGTASALTGSVKIENSVFDGQSLLDISVFPEKYSRYSMLLLRQRMFKSACFKTDIRRFFADNDIRYISQLNGFTLAKSVDQIKIITTPSSIKYSKFGKPDSWLKKLEPVFGIVKHEKPTRYMSGRMVSCNYQLLNTLRLSRDETAQLLRPTLDYITQVRNDPDVMRFHLGLNRCADDRDERQITTNNDIIFHMLSVNPEFTSTKMYLDFRDELIRSLINKARFGHILVNGNYSVLFGNGYEMLLESINAFNGESIIGTGSIYSKRFGPGKKILCARSPHICAGNILLVTNTENRYIDRYFPLSEEVVYINSIGENTLQRLNGADFDSDTMLLTDEPLLVEAAEREYGNYPVPTCLIASQKLKRTYTPAQLSDLDTKTSINKIGEIVNLSQLLNSILSERLNNGESFDDVCELYMDICVLAVLSGIEIDRAKKEYSLNSTQEINRIKKKYEEKQIVDGKEKTVKPVFFRMISAENGSAPETGTCYRYFRTTMDYIQKQISVFTFHTCREPKKPPIPFSAILGNPDAEYPLNGHNYKKCTQIIENVRESTAEINALFIDYDTKSKDEREEIRIWAEEMKRELYEYINSAASDEATLTLLLRAADKPENRDIRRRVLTAFFSSPNKLFMELIRRDSDKLQLLTEDSGGEIKIYGKSYKKDKAG